jgi:hypothetical protein
MKAAAYRKSRRDLRARELAKVRVVLLAECNQFCQPVQRYAATPCNGMLPLNATLCCHLVCEVSSTPEACGAAVAVGLGRCPVRARGSKVRFADQPPRTRSAAAASTRLKASLATPKWDKAFGYRHVRGITKTPPSRAQKAFPGLTLMSRLSQNTAL